MVFVLSYSHGPIRTRIDQKIIIQWWLVNLISGKADIFKMSGRTKMFSKLLTTNLIINKLYIFIIVAIKYKTQL